MKLVERFLFIDAPPARVYELLTDAALLARWMAPQVATDPQPGGSVEWTHANGDSVIGEYVELVPARRVVFTYGWDRPDVEIPPGSTTVEITLRPERGGTRLHLVHRGLSGPMADAHNGGWANYLERLASCAEDRDPGEDPLRNERVPAARDLAAAFDATGGPLAGSSVLAPRAAPRAAVGDRLGVDNLSDGEARPC